MEKGQYNVDAKGQYMVHVMDDVKFANMWDYGGHFLT